MSRFPFRSRPRAVWAAFITALVLVLVSALGVLPGVLGVIATADAGTAGILRVPVLQIVAALLIGYVLAALLLLLCFRRRNGAVAWVLGVAAVVSALLVSLWPLVVVAIAGSGQVQELAPVIGDLFDRVTGG